MKKSARRVPRKIGQDDEDDSSAADQSSDSAIRRPTTKPRKSSSLRTSIGPTAIEDEDDSEVSVVTPKRSNLSRVAIQRNASKRSSLLASQLPLRQSNDDEEDERPSYSASSLQQLKNSTPATPQDFSSATNTDVEDVSTGTQALDITSKFGSSLAQYQQQQSSAIPSAAEIAEKKARRLRLAKEQQAEEYISLDPDDPDLDHDELDDNVMKDESGRLVLKPKDKYGQAESRLVRDDEDIMEDFDDFTDDGKISLGRKAEADAARRRKQDMAAQIAQAEGASDSDSDSERERNAAFEAAQTKHGAYSQNTATSEPSRPRTPPVITPLPTLDGVIERLRKQLADMQSSRMQRLQEMEHLQREKIRLAEEEVRIQRALKETAEKFEVLRKEKGISGAKKDGAPAIEAAPAPDANGGSGAAQCSGQQSDDHEMGEDDDDTDASGFAGLGFGGRRGLGAGLGLGIPPAADDSDSNGNAS